MSMGYICDRCGVTFDGGGRWLRWGHTDGSRIVGEVDLCPDCMDSFAYWMDRGLMAEAPEESADCVSSNDGEHATADREHSLESESVREQSESVRERRYESQDVTGDAGHVTESPEMSHDTRKKLESDIRRFYDDHECHSFMSVDFLDFVYGWLDRQAIITERETLHSHPICAGSDACPALNRPIGESADREMPETSENDASKGEIRDFDDTREKLEEDVRTYMFPWRVDMALDWLDRQASITEAECERICDTCDWPSLAAQPDQEAYDRIAELGDQVDALTAERDQWRDAYRDSEQMRLELVKDLEHARRWNDRWRDLVHRYERLCDGLLDERDRMRGELP